MVRLDVNIWGVGQAWEHTTFRKTHVQKAFYLKVNFSFSPFEQSLLCYRPGGVKHTMTFIRLSLWQLSKSLTSLAEHSGFRRKEVFCYWRSLAALSATTVSCFGAGFWSLIQRTENCWRRWPCAQPAGQQSLGKPFLLNSQHTGRGQRVAYTLRHINQLVTD